MKTYKFYEASNIFENFLINEANNNIENSINLQESLFQENPGGHFFKYLDKGYKLNLKFFNQNQKEIKQITHNISNYLKYYYPDHILKNIIKKYSHLF